MALSLSSSELAVQWDYCKPAVGAVDPPLIRNSYPWMLDCSSPHFALVTAETAVMVSDERGEEEKNLHSQPPKFLCPAHNQKRKWMNSNSVCQKMRITTAQRRRISGQGEKERRNICNGCGYGFPSANLHFDWLAALFSFRFFNSISLPSINAHPVHMYTFECVCLVFKFKGNSFWGTVLWANRVQGKGN